MCLLSYFLLEDLIDINPGIIMPKQQNIIKIRNEGCVIIQNAKENNNPITEEIIISNIFIFVLFISDIS